MMNPSEIGFIVIVLLEKSWGKNPVGGRLRSQNWWKDRLESIIEDKTEYTLPNDYSWKPSDIDCPIPFEIEIGMTELNYDTLFQAFKRMETNA